MLYPEIRYGYKLLVILLVVLLSFLESGCQKNKLFEVSKTGKSSDPLIRPWTRWWWMGSSVTKDGITEHLEAFKEIGLGGVEIVPIYGERGDEENFIHYLSARWIEMLLHTLREADRLNLGVDITLGSGWPYGGPWITEEYAAERYNEVTGEGELTDQMVKRAAPGAEGLVVDHFNPIAMQFFLSRFDSLMQLITREELPLRAIFNDSYEVYGADWTSDFPEAFYQKRGYPFPESLLNPNDSTLAETSSYWQDYHLTLSELIFEAAGKTIRNWCDKYGLQYRYQAHGSPSNLLDLYGLASIPETECFGSSKFNIPLVPTDTNYNEDQFDRPHPLIYKFASSPANILGKTLVSSETATWLADHFKVSLSQVKPQVDELFINGINHIFYHGIAYSPFDKDFPGRLFYASTNFGPTGALWKHLDGLNDYIKNCQTVLQNSLPDNDLLLYYPVFDLWNNKGNDGNLMVQGVHNTKAWLFNTSFGRTALELYDAGYAFDYISDQQLGILANNPAMRSKSYRVVIIPRTTYMPAETARNLNALREKGLQVYFLDTFPDKAPGYRDQQNRSDQLNAVLQSPDYSDHIFDDMDTLLKALSANGISPENIKQNGISYIRKLHKNGYIYFISNLGDTFINDHYPLARDFKAIEIYDPLTGKRGKAQIEGGPSNAMVRLQLRPGQSLFLITYNKDIKQTAWKYISKEHEWLGLSRHWKMSIDNKLDAYELDSLQSWTKLPFDWAPYYCGTVTYTVAFEYDISRSDAETVILDLGDLRYMASARLNNEKIGDFWCVPFQKTVPPDLLKTENSLVIEVTNLDANRIIQMDREHIPWKNFYEINFVDISYQPFDASDWEPVSSGLLGPVRIIPVSLE